MCKIILFLLLSILIPSLAHGGSYSCVVVKVVDGDTVVCSPLILGFGLGYVEEKVRLSGVNTPESFRASCESEKIEGFKAKSRLSNLVLGKKVTVLTNPKKERGKFGRILGRIVTEGVDINSTLIDEGYAVKYDGGKRINHWCENNR